jgi:hypothetical protein
MMEPATRKVDGAIVRGAIGISLRRLYEDMEKEPLPKRLQELMSRLEARDENLTAVGDRAA